MDQAKLLSIIGTIYDKFVADVSERLKGQVALEVDRLLKDRTDIDRELVTTWIKDELQDVLGDLDDRISEYMSNNFDITDYEDNLDINDKVSDYLSDNLRDEVRDEVRNLSFSVTVE